MTLVIVEQENGALFSIGFRADSLHALLSSIVWIWFGQLMTRLLSVFLPSAYLGIPSGRWLFDEGSPDLELEGERKHTIYKFRQVRAARVA
jgi:hypothetical protein